jgi:[ribosomal protein S5]-alanine N-acetyltransferase
MRLETERLILRAVEEDDAPDLFPIMNDPEVTENLLLPHPYPEERVTQWIISGREALQRAERYEIAVVPKDTGRAIGVCSLYRVSWEHMSAELVYWIGKEYWGKGYITEAARRMLEFGFKELGLERICVGCFARNTASERVIEKLGFKPEGLARGEFKKGDQRFDALHFGMLREDFIK